MNAPISEIDLWGMQGRAAERGVASPAAALIYQNRNNGIEYHLKSFRDEFQAQQDAQAVGKLINQIPARYRKKMFTLRIRIEWMVARYGVNHVGLQTMTIRENVTDRKEFERRFKSIATNAFPKIYLEWLRVFERQQRGAWHAHVVVVTKDDIRTGTDVVGLNQLLKDKRDRKISQATYYAGIKRMASENLRNIWKEFRRLCGLKEFQSRRRKGKYYKFDACHLLPIINSAQALAAYVSKYISKGFGQRRPEDKGMRLVGCTRNVSRLCNERFSWANGGGKLHRLKLGVLAGLLKFNSLDDFKENFGSKWAYHLQPILAPIVLPYYEDMKLAAMDGWDLENERGEPWPLPDLEPPAKTVQRSHFQAFVAAKEIILHRTRCRKDRRGTIPKFKLPAVANPQPRQAFRSWIELTAKND
jgi:hypothetical protein